MRVHCSDRRCAGGTGRKRELLINNHLFPQGYCEQEAEKTDKEDPDQNLPWTQLITDQLECGNDAHDNPDAAGCRRESLGGVILENGEVALKRLKECEAEYGRED